MDDQSPRFDRGGHAASEDQPHTAAVLLADTDPQHQLATLTVPTPPTYPRNRCVHDLVAEQAAQHPDAIALVYGDAQLTYGDLDQQANRLAHHLQTLGAGPDTLIGLCMERSIELVVSMLAVLKSGAAYVPLDPSYPTERLQFMLNDTQAPVVLTMQRFRSLLPSHAGQTIDLESLRPTLARLPETAPAHRATADHLAYVMYTSGSTGRPKGISIPHHGITRLVCNTNYVQLTSSDRVLQASNTAFDAATFEIWGTLVNGARVVGVDRETALVPERFVAALREQAITVAFMTTAWFNQVVNLSPEAFDGLRALLFGGEACDPQRVQQVLSSHAPARLLHVYGPTESTTFSSWYPVTTVPADATTVPIGYPVANTQIYLLDTHGRQVPPGAVGELYIGGDGLARGYLDRPELTAEKFVPDPFGGTPGARLYRTGDIGRAQDDGAIEFVGRIDDQIKLRGFRIELGEIESVLRQHPQVRDVVVVAREDQPGDMRLVAYIVEEPRNRVPCPEGARRTKEQKSTTDSPSPMAMGEGEIGYPLGGAGDEGQPNNLGLLSTLRAFLGERLPAYMVPSAFVLLDALPLTPNGKVDRKALPQPEPDRASLDTPLVAPRTPMEELVAQIWAEVLHLQQIGIHDNIL
ncbi:MAG TPA: amino acid adenylation domain-containing protein, partial [Herpetosiphonaceae bacterium]